jgi:YesN/AraC family two-component response regulator
MIQTYLIVEDSLLIRELYRICLKDIALEFLGEAVDGAAAIQKIMQLQPDLVLLDLVLPEKNGFDVLSACAHLRTKFIVVSSLPRADYEAKVKSLGALFYLEKPFKKQQLIQAIESAASTQLEVNNG